MRAVILSGPRQIAVEEVPDPAVVLPGDAVVRVLASCVCGSDLWPYRGIRQITGPIRMGHEFVGVVEETGSQVTRLQVGDLVIAPFYYCDLDCRNCRNGVSTSCLTGGWWGAPDRNGHFADGGQGEFVRVPLAETTLVAVPETAAPELLPDLLALSDVMGTGYHAAACAEVGEGSTVVVVGDGAVGLCAVIAARLRGASRIIAMSRNPERQRLAREFGATDVVAERGDEGIAHVKDLLDGMGADHALECVGARDSMVQALHSIRPGGSVGFVGIPNGGAELPIRELFTNNLMVRGGFAPVRGYLDALLPAVLDRRINPGRVFDAELPLADADAAYRAMDERRAIKVLLRP